MGFFNADASDAVPVHFVNDELLSAVIACVADCGNSLQAREKKTRQSFEAGISRKQQIILRLEISQADCPLQYQGLGLTELGSLLNYIGYVETLPGMRPPNKTEMMRICDELERNGAQIGSSVLASPNDVWSAIRKFFVQQAEHAGAQA